MEIKQDKGGFGFHSELGVLEKTAIGVVTAVILAMLMWIGTNMSNVLVRVAVIENDIKALIEAKVDNNQALKDLERRVMELEGRNNERTSSNRN